MDRTSLSQAQLALVVQDGAKVAQGLGWVGGEARCEKIFFARPVSIPDDCLDAADHKEQSEADPGEVWLEGGKLVET